MRTTTLALTVGLALLLSEPIHAASAAPAPADGASSLEKARAHFRQGVQLYKETSFEAALAEFRKAYQLSPTFRVLYNIAQTYFELHDYVNAYETLKQYLQEGGKEITAGRRAEVDEMNRKLEERIARLEVIVSKDGADVRVDDISVGTSPLKSPVLVNAGPRKVTAAKPGHDGITRLVTVSGAEKLKVVLEIPDPVAAPVSTAAPSEPAPVEVTEPVAVAASSPLPAKPSRAGLIASLTVAGACAVVTGVFGFLALDAKKDFDKQLDRIPNTKDSVDDARGKTRRYAYLTDTFGAATLLATGVAVYFALTRDGGSTKPRSVALAPTLGGLVLDARW
jgi:hypothetical protein